MTDEYEYGPWIIWNGGECPVAEDVRGQAQYRKETREQAEEMPAQRLNSRQWRYSHIAPGCDVIAYRVMKEPVRGTFQLERYAKAFGTTDFMTANTRIDDEFVKGTATVDTIDGLPVRILWEAGQ